TEHAVSGELRDQRGRVLAGSTLGYRLFVDPEVVEDIHTIGLELGTILDRDPVAISKAIFSTRPDSRYAVVIDRLEDGEVNAIRDANLPGVGLTPRLVRHYPHGTTGESIVGLVGFEHHGLSGFEHMFDGRLTSEDGSLRYLRDVQGRAMWISPANYLPPTDGDDVWLSLDLVIQEIAEKHLRAAVQRQNAGGGRLVVVDPETGELLAMTDVLNPRPGWEEQTEDPLRTKRPRLARNRCVTDPYEPGSTFKPFVWSVATDMGLATLDEELPTPAHPAYRTSKGRRIRDTYYTENATWHTVLLKSLNSGMAIVAERMTHAEMQDAIARFGFGSKTRSGLPGETAGIVTPPGKWTHYTQTSVSMGHEIAVTPLQMARAFCVFAGDGTLPSLRVTAERRGDARYRVVNRILPEETIQVVRTAMRDVMDEGSGRKCRSEIYQMFGKSGTAQLPKRDGGGYHEDRYVSSFIAGAPFETPRVVVVCVIDDPDKALGHYGGAIAGPVVRDVIDEVLQYLGVVGDIEPPAPDEG
ncbi:MAG: peptidoglycan D,D-transpeptidase FtsI family protein, partial [Planctomycetota bacterium]